MAATQTLLALFQLGAGVLESTAQIQQGAIEAQAQEFAAGSDIFNADIARQEARLVQIRAKLDIKRKRKEQEALIGTQRVLFAISGVRIDEGTPLIVLQETLEATELDILITQFNADVESQRLESQARFDELRAEQRKSVAGQVRTAASLRAAKTLLGSVSSFGQKFAGGTTTKAGTNVFSDLTSLRSASFIGKTGISNINP